MKLLNKQDRCPCCGQFREKQNTARLSLETILAITASHFKVAQVMIKGRSRKRAYAEARQVYCYFARHYTTYSLKKIGQLINRDHTTVIHGSQTVQDLIETRHALAFEVEQLIEILRPREEMEKAA